MTKESHESATRETAPSTGADTSAETNTGTGQHPRQGLSPSGCTTTEELRQEAEDFLHDCDRSARYHAARRAFFDKWHRWMMVAVVFSGSAAVATLTEGSTALTVWIMLIPPAIGAVSVVFSLTDRARDHEFLGRRFYQIAQSIDPQHATAERVSQWRVDILSVYEDEPAVYHALNAECYNAASQALGKKERQRIGPVHHYLRNWRRFSAEDFPQYHLGS